MELGTDLLIKGSTTDSGAGTDLSIRTHNYLFLTFGKYFAFGPVYFYEHMHAYETDTILGAGIRFGNKVFFEIDGGILERKYKTNFGTSKGKGGAIVPILGYHFNCCIRISIAYSVKKFDEDVAISPLGGTGIGKRLRTELVPYFGIKLPW